MLPAMTVLPKWINDKAKLPKSKGAYLLTLHLAEDQTIKIGKAASIECPAGTYYYVGSAMGAGGIASRVGRHFRHDKDKKLRWHIDHLRAQMTVMGCWVWESEDKIECLIAQGLRDQAALEWLPHIGCSDCHCQSHVYFLPSPKSKQL